MEEIDPAVAIELEALQYVKPIEEATKRGDSEIQNFYRNASIFITGGSGFIGKQLIEKLFRSCDIKKVFILIRPKKGVPVKERLQAILSDPVFETVRKKKPDLASRIVSVEGDVADIRLGISDGDWERIVNEVDIMFHVAATIRFDETIRTAALINVRGTREVLKLAKACKKLRSFVHVSTAYCHATSEQCGQDVLEQFYQTPLPPETLLQLVETVDNSRLDTITSSLITNWPNTYTFTKAVAEELVQREIGNLPICIVRPSIVLSTYREPIPGWLDVSCMYGPSGIVLGVGIGVTRVLYVNNKAKLSFVPVDYVNNATIAAAWETGTRKTNDEAKIYHISTTNCGVTFRHVSVPMREEKIRGIISPKTVWYCFLIETYSRFLFWILSWLLHYIPAYVVDGIINVFRLKKPQGLKSFVHVYTKFDKLVSIFQFFLTNEWNFDDTNLKSLREKMSETDKMIYNFDMESIDWAHNTCMWCLGVRKYVIKDGLTGTIQARARQKWFKVAHYTIVVFYLYIFWKILAWIWCVLSYIF